MAGPPEVTGRKKPVTLKEVAQDAGVSLATASFVLSGRGGAGSSGSEATKRKVRASAQKLGYVPNRYARAMRTGRSNAIVLALGTISDPWGHSVAEAVRSAARPRNYSTVILADDTWDTFLRGYASDAAYIEGADYTPGSLEKLRTVARSGVNLVVHSEHTDADGFDVIAAPSRDAVFSAYARLRRNHERVSLLTRYVPNLRTRPDYPSNSHAFLDAMLAYGDSPDAPNVFLSARNSQSDVQTYCTKILMQPDRPTAVVALDARVATVMRVAAARCGLSVPNDLEIIVIGDGPRDQDATDTMSYYGVRDVFERIASIIVNRAVEGNDTPFARHVFEWEFFEGATTRGSSAEDEGVAHSDGKVRLQHGR